MAEKKGPKGFVEIVQRARAATVAVATADLTQQGNQAVFANFISHGSGFFINRDGLLLTARHVVPSLTTPSRVYFILHRSNSTSAWYATSRSLTHDFPDIDVCAIKFDRKVGWLPLSQYLPKQGAEIAVYGFPASQIQINNGQINGDLIKPRASKATISSIQAESMSFTGATGIINVQGKTMIESQFVFIKGNSGGPVLDAKTGKVVGIVTGVQNIPQDARLESVTLNNQNQNVIGIPYASYSFAMSISEVIPRLVRGSYSHWWR